VTSGPGAAVHASFLIVGLVCLAAINVLFIVDIELTLSRNKENQTDEERQWGFGQILALLLLVVPLRDARNALRDIRNRFQQRFEQLFQTAAEAKPVGETVKALDGLVTEGANPRKPISGRFANVLQLAVYYGKQELIDFILRQDRNKRIPVDVTGRSMNLHRVNGMKHFQVEIMRRRFRLRPLGVTMSL
jgi:hypothetical protein